AAVDADFVAPSGPPSGLDLHLRAGSTKIDAGVALGADDPDDVDGDARPSGGHFDVGADEWSAPTDAGPAGSESRRLLAVYPSIIRRGGDVHVVVPDSGGGDCAMFDVAGHRVRTLRLAVDAG